MCVSTGETLSSPINMHIFSLNIDNNYMVFTTLQDFSIVMHLWMKVQT